MNDQGTPPVNAPVTDLREFVLAGFSLLAVGAQANPSAEERWLREQATQLPRNDWSAWLESYLEHPAEQDRRLVLLARELDLETVELLALVVTLAVEEDSWFGRVVAWLQAPLGGSRPTLGLLDAVLANLLSSAENGRWLAGEIVSGRAVESGLLQRHNENSPLPEQGVHCPLPLVLALRGQPYRWPGTEDRVPEVDVAPSLQAEVKRQAATLDGRRGLLLRSGSAAEARSVATAVCAEIAGRPLFVDQATEERTGLGILCRLDQRIPVFICDPGPGEQLRLPSLPGYQGPVLAIAGPDGTVEPARGVMASWTVPVPLAKEREAMWYEQLGDTELAADLARQHLHGAARIRELGSLARREATLGGRRTPRLEDVRTAAWAGDGGGLGALAEPMAEAVPEGALVLGRELEGELGLLESRCRAREGLAQGLGISIAARYRVGVRTLMVGPSGTGKTLAAGWLATRLGLPLYRVDLASVTSKYIGETEKNLAQLLARAEQAEVVLLFDEADSLFGKRTEIKDANDRYANAQTNYLLQRIESYNGIVLLTSNSRARFDSAFTRRIDMIVDFPMPGPKQRRSLWRSHLGSHNSLSTSQINRLAASVDFSGGHIRNTVLTAAVLAKGDKISFVDIVDGLKLEYRKLGQKVPLALQQQAQANAKPGKAKADPQTSR